MGQDLVFGDGELLHALAKGAIEIDDGNLVAALAAGVLRALVGHVHLLAAEAESPAGEGMDDLLRGTGRGGPLPLLEELVCGLPGCLIDQPLDLKPDPLLLGLGHPMLLVAG
jgi:hypothetical protein